MPDDAAKKAVFKMTESRPLRTGLRKPPPPLAGEWALRPIVTPFSGARELGHCRRGLAALAENY
eukprot:14464570-Alexandrium_andersonii.AAC.1